MNHLKKILQIGVETIKFHYLKNFLLYIISKKFKYNIIYFTNMERDISNTFIHNLIEERIQDLSNNPQAQFLGMLVNMLNGNSNFNSNLAMLPLANNFVNTQISQSSNLNRILNDSLLMEKTPYKKILSDKGNEQLKTVKYNKDKFEQDSCCIMFVDFEEGQDVIQLPCGHIFDPDGIKTWLKEEQAKCPICRFELDSREVKDEDSDSEEEIPLLDGEEEESDLSNNTDIDHTYNQLFQNIGFINNPIENLYRPRRRNLINQRRFVNEIINVENQFLENRIMQNAIMASIYEQNGFQTSEDEAPQAFEEDDIHLEEFSDSDI